MRRFFAFLFRHKWTEHPKTDKREIGMCYRLECEKCGKLSIWFMYQHTGLFNAILEMKGCPGKVSK